jgi:hypothetical protein
MNIAFLFNSDASKYNGFYGYPIKKKVIGTGILRASSRRMRMHIGDIVTYGHVARRENNRTYGDLAALEAQVYQSNDWSVLLRKRLEATYAKTTKYCLLFQNMSVEVAQNLHDALKSDTAYLGAMSVDFSNPLHLVFFRNSLIELCRLEGNKCSVFYSMGENEDPDISLKELFEKNGYVVDYEDRGARRTIFDNYDSLEHFTRVEAFKRAVATFEGIGKDGAANITLNLEELHPYLFDILFAALDALSRAQTAEQFAHVALSGRRFLEFFADAIFPAQSAVFQGRKGPRSVGKTNYRNRLWAFIEMSLYRTSSFEEARFQRLGKEADRLSELFNSGLHHSANKPTVTRALSELIVWVSELIEIDPPAFRNAYAPYAAEMKAFFLDAFKDKRQAP